MTTAGIVVPPGEGSVARYTPGRESLIKLTGDATGHSVMLFEQSLPVGTKSTLHLHRDSDEIAYVLEGEITFLIGEEVTTGGPGTCAFMPRDLRHAWKNTGAEAARAVFFYTPARAGGLIEEQQRTGSSFSSMSKAELDALLERHGWELLGPSPL